MFFESQANFKRFFDRQCVCIFFRLFQLFYLLLVAVDFSVSSLAVHLQTCYPLLLDVHFLLNYYYEQVFCLFQQESFSQQKRLSLPLVYVLFYPEFPQVSPYYLLLFFSCFQVLPSSKKNIMSKHHINHMCNAQLDIFLYFFNESKNTYSKYYPYIIHT